MSGLDGLISHLQTGATTTCRTWQVTRKDGVRLGFTDHDRDLEFEGTIFKASSGLTASTLQKSLGFSVDNTEVMGALSDAAISEADISAGRYDGAEVVIWFVNWADVAQRTIRFRGHFGEIQYSDSKFKVELRGLTDALNKSRGRVYQPNCPVALGDSECRVDLTNSSYIVETIIKSINRSGEYYLPSQPGFPENWFTYGRAVVISGVAKDLEGFIAIDQEVTGFRKIALAQNFNVLPEIGDEIRIEAGCNKLASTCRTKFNNFLNFRGFPNIPSSDWVTSYPVSSQRNDGGSRTR